MTQLIRRPNLILCLIQVLKAGKTIMLLILRLKLKKGPQILYLCIILRHSEGVMDHLILCQLIRCIICIVIKIPEDDKFKRHEAVQQLLSLCKEAR